MKNNFKYNSSQEVLSLINSVYGNESSLVKHSMISREKSKAIFKTFDLILNHFQNGNTYLSVKELSPSLSFCEDPYSSAFECLFWFSSDVMPLIDPIIGTSELEDLTFLVPIGDLFRALPKLKEGPVKLSDEVVLTPEETFLYFTPTEMLFLFMQEDTHYKEG